MRYAFTFDASACTGCKACQVACKDKNALPTGMLWRRVYEVSGGGWERRGAAWTDTVFAYNVSVSCNHCADPACVAACPTGACTVRDDGIVWIEEETCAGCEYCAWACPYSAPQYSPSLGRTTKCDFCRDLVDEGLSPACVAACPMRALDVVRLAADVPRAAAPFPLPEVSTTQPSVIVKPHHAMRNSLPKAVANREEVHPAGARPPRTIAGLPTGELPLVAFTLLSQAAAGTAVVSLASGPMTAPLLATIGGLSAAATLASLLHLGTIAQAWRAPGRPLSSPLSREILALGLFAVAWLVTWFVPAGGRVMLAVAGLAWLYAIGEVYRLEGVPAWRRWRTHGAFASSALLLGVITVVAASALVPWWLAAITGAAALADQVPRRVRFYGATLQKLM